MKLSIKTVLSGFLGLFLISITAILASSYLTSEKVLQDHAKVIMGNVSMLTIQQSQSYLKPAHDVVELTRHLANSSVLSSKNSSILERYFTEQLTIHPQISGIYFGTPDGEFVYVMKNNSKVPGGFKTKFISLDKGTKKTEIVWRDDLQKEIYRELDPEDTYDPRDRPWYKKALNAGALIWADPYIFFTSQKPGITAASPAYLPSGRIYGIVGVDMEIDNISIFLSKLKVGKNGSAYILNRNGDVIAFPDRTKMKQPLHSGSTQLRLVKITELNDPLSRKAYESVMKRMSNLDLSEPVFSMFSHENKRYHVMFSPFSDRQWPWVIGVYLPEDDYLGPIKQNRLFNSILGIGIAFIATIIGLFIARSISKPLTALQSEAMAIKGYDLDTTFDKKSIIKEVQQTSDAFVQMKAGLKDFKTTNNKITADLKQQAAELKQNDIQLRSTFTSLINFADALIVLDTDNSIRFMNPAAESLLQADATPMIGRQFPYPVTKKKKTELSIPASHNSVVIVEMLTVDTEWEGQGALLVSLRDVSERNRAEESLHKSNQQLKHMVVKLKRREEELTTIGKMAEFFQVCTTEKEILRIISENMESLFPVESGTVYLLNNEKKTLSNVYSWGGGSLSSDMFKVNECWALKKGQIYELRAGESTLYCGHNKSTDTQSHDFLCIPIATSHRQLGLLYLQFSLPAAGREEQRTGIEPLLELGRTVAEHIALTLSNVRMQEKLKEMAIQDHLTGLYNRRYMQENLEREIHLAARNKKPIGLILIDIDHFKSINDEYGHSAGDQVLKTLAELLSSNVRKGDICCRYGGEEFLFVLQNSSYADTFALAESLRKQVKKMDIIYDNQHIGNLTISLGVAVYPEQANTYAALIKAADSAMYRAKHKGRDHVS